MPLKTFATQWFAREFQNSLDAADDSEELVSLKVRITLGEVPPSRVRAFFPGMFDHLAALRDKLPDIPNPDEPVKFLTFEDFNTTGLRGDPEQWEPVEGQTNALFNSFRSVTFSSRAAHPSIANELHIPHAL